MVRAGNNVPSSQPSTRRVSTQIYLFALVAAVLVPLLAFIGFLLVRYAAIEQTRLEREALQLARQVSLVIDAELRSLIAQLNGLAASAALARGDLAEFHTEATRMIGARDELVVLRDLGTRQLVNTQRPFGEALPPAIPLRADDLAAYEAGRARVTGVYASPLSGEPRIAVALPIVLSQGQTHILALTVPTTRIRDVLLTAVSAGWIVGIGDREGTYVTRSARHEDISGKPGLPEYLAKASGRAGTFISTNFEGTALLAGYYRSDFSEWLTGANIPLETVQAPLRRSLMAFAAVGIAALILSATLAYLLGSSLTAAARGLAQRAAALGEGRPVTPFSSRLAESALVGDTLASAAAAIDQRARERNLLINELNHRVKNTLTTVQSIAQQTLRGAISAEKAREAFTQRVIALAKAHDVLTRESWEGAELTDILALATGPYAAHRFVLAGPAVRLGPAVTLSLALALHELATNAAKYGALSTENGIVRIDWAIRGERLELSWRETGGPAVKEPAHRGFGSRLLERLFSAEGGSAQLRFAPDGLVCELVAPLPKAAAAA
jgi:two-component sensor histidine kinase